MVDSMSFNGPIPSDSLFGKEADNFRSLSAMSNPMNRSICEGPSKISGPIAAHYGYENETDKNLNKILELGKVPKVRGDGFTNFRAYKEGTGVNLLITSQQKPILETFRERKKPKNYMASNTVKIREIMKRVKERQAQKESKLEKSKPVKAVDKFDHVESKLKELLVTDPKAPREPKYEFLKAHSRPGSGPIKRRPQTAREAPTDTSGELAAAAASANNRKAKDDIDFIKHNQDLAKQIKLRRAPSVDMLKSLQEKTNKQLEAYMEKQKGKVPDYIEKRREEIRKAHAEYVKNIPDPDQPPGHKKLPEEERIKTLTLLQDAQKKLLGEMNSLPIRNDTFRMQQKKTECEKRLCEIDEAIKIFSKPKVFVKIDS